MPSRLYSFSSAALLLLLVVVGCSQQITPPKTVPVTGSVMRHGKPFPGVTVTFHPQFSMGKVDFEPSGETDAAGKFVLSTGAGGDGAPPGDYVVTAVKMRVDSDPNQSGIEVEIDELRGKYDDQDKSEWIVTIENGKNELEPFVIE